MAIFRQFFLLLWKNFVLQKRHPLATLFELGVPTIFSILLMFIRTNVESDYISNSTLFKSFNIDSLPHRDDTIQVKNVGSKTYGSLFTSSIDPYIFFSPNETYTEDVMKIVATRLKISIKGFDNEQDILDEIKSFQNTYVLGAIIFNHEAGSNEFGETISFKVRLRATPSNSDPTPNNPNPSWLTQLTFPVFPNMGPRSSGNNGGTPGYYKEGFLALQNQISKGVIESLTNDSTIFDKIVLKMQRYPYPPYINDYFMMALQFFFPLILLLSFIYPALNIVKNVVIEKEKRLKESMKMMGLSNWLHWIAWFIKYLLFLSISAIVMTIVMSVKVKDNLAVLDKTDPSLLFVFIFVYVISTISFCFLISTLFSKANSAAAGAGILFFLAFVPYFVIVQRYNTLSHYERLASCLLSNTALSLGAMLISKWEGTGVGATWNNLDQTISQDDSMTMQIVLVMLLLDTVLYLLLTWYIEAVLPGEYGVPLPWYFPFTKSYWCGASVDLSGIELLENTEKHSEFLESDPIGLMTGIQIMGLSKIFPKKKVAVNNINLNIYRGQITALLGHNGAGKTTTLSMLTGLFPPTSGSAIVNGYDIQDHIEGVHSSLGICPQHDILFDELTVEEHLYFFCKLKGYLPDLVKSEIQRMLTALCIEDKRNTYSKELSGGMKRKLSVGMALVGGSQVVMLDEPTSGMDPAARRFTWDLLQSEKEDRTILLTTHFMEEADILGDRIAIMAGGEVQCCGSPLFLKKKYGAGYHLVMVKERQCQVEVVNELIKKHVPNAEMESNIGAELSFSLPHDSSHKFGELFRTLQDNQEALGVNSFGASITTMEEVFLRVGEYSQTGMSNLMRKTDIASSTQINQEVNFGSSHSTGLNIDPSNSTVTLCTKYRNRGAKLIVQQFGALFWKRVLHTYRHWLITFFQVILPVMYITITLTILKTIPKPEDSPELVLNLAPFKRTSVPYSVCDDFNGTFLTDYFASQFKSPNVACRIDGPPVNTTITPEENLINYLISQGEKDLPEYNMHNMVAASFNNFNETHISLSSVFNNQAYHTPAIALATMHNALLKYFTGISSQFVVINHPLPRTTADKAKQQQTQGTESYQIAQDIMFAMSFLMASFSIFLVKERYTKAKHLQKVSGVNLVVFWASTYIWDFINYIIPCIAVLFVILAFQNEAMSSTEQQGRLLLLFILYGLAGLPFIYVLSFLFSISTTAYTRLSLLNIVAGIGCLLSVTILEIPLLELQNISKILDWIFTTIFPHYCLGRSTYNLYQNYQYNKNCMDPTVVLACQLDPVIELVKPCCKGKCGDVCLPWEENFLSWEPPGIGRALFFLVFQIFLYNFLLFACEQNLFRKLKYFFCQKNRIASSDILPSAGGGNVLVPQYLSKESLLGQQDELPEDEDVVMERDRILNTPLGQLQTTDAIILRELTKYYSSFLAVNKLSLGIRKGECFGLLGLNGAGKTTTFKMLTGDEIISSGNAYMDGFSVKTDMRFVQQRIGYCPQFDAVIDQMTGRETLTMFAHLRGVPREHIPKQVYDLGKLLYFDIHLDKLVKDFSGGNKRKLSTAIALIGDSPIIFLDEPTTGMDPVARRCLWDAVIKIIEAGRSVVLTSHSMEECEALCNRLVIMVNGKLCCLGSPQHLKHKFGQGFTLLIKVGRYTIRGNQSPWDQNRPPSEGANAQASLSSFNQADFNSQTTAPVTMNNDVDFIRDIDEVKTFMESTFPSCVLKSAHQGLLHYHIAANQNHTWAEMFDTMESAKVQFNIENYSVGQTTLEQVFLNFSRAQRQTKDS